MTTNTKSAQERTASIDLAQLDEIFRNWKSGVISAQEAMIDIGGLLARRSLTSGAAGAWIQYVDSVKTQNVARDQAEKDQIERISAIMNPTSKMTWEALYATHVHDAAAPSAEQAYKFDAQSIKPLLNYWFGLEDCKGLFNAERLLSFANDAIAKSAGAAAKTEQSPYCSTCASLESQLRAAVRQRDEARVSAAGAGSEFDVAVNRLSSFIEKHSDVLASSGAAGAGSAQAAAWANPRDLETDEHIDCWAYKTPNYSVPLYRHQAPRKSIELVDCGTCGCQVSVPVDHFDEAHEAPSRDAGQEEASTQTVPSIDTPEFRELMLHWHLAETGEPSRVARDKIIAYIDGRTAGIAGGDK